MPNIFQLEPNLAIQRPDSGSTGRCICVIASDFKIVFANECFWDLIDLSPASFQFCDLKIVLGSIRCDELRSKLTQIFSKNSAAETVSLSFKLADERRYLVTLDSLIGDGLILTVEPVISAFVPQSAPACLGAKDEVTGLLTRASFHSTSSQLLQSTKEEVAVLFIDLDHFKNVNDTLGHPFGDQVLEMVAQRLRKLTRDYDAVARLNGDEFAILQVGGIQPAAGKAMARRIVSSLNEPMLVDGQTVNISCCIGIAIYPFDGETIDDLLRNSDMALYSAKNAGRGTIQFFEPHLAEKASRSRKIECELRDAIEKGQFEMHFQPLMNLETNTLVSFEALIRWMHPTMGCIPPDHFIPLAEETGLIVPLGEWIIRYACQIAAKWDRPFGVAVNLSTVQLSSRRLIPVVIEALKESGLPAERLELEITETALISDSSTAIATLHQLRDYGIRIAMDDFGTGYSSINYLRKFPFDKIKIDRSFVTGIDQSEGSYALVKMITALGDALGISTTAEGVETEGEREFARSAGCTEIQGYLLSRPVPSWELNDLIGRLT